MPGKHADSIHEHAHAILEQPLITLFVFRYSTPLHDAVCCGRQEVVTILVERGANVNELDYKNMTPLKLAVR